MRAFVFGVPDHVLRRMTRAEVYAARRYVRQVARVVECGIAAMLSRKRAVHP